MTDNPVKFGARAWAKHAHWWPGFAAYAGALDALGRFATIWVADHAGVALVGLGFALCGAALVASLVFRRIDPLAVVPVGVGVALAALPAFDDQVARLLLASVGLSFASAALSLPIHLAATVIGAGRPPTAPFRPFAAGAVLGVTRIASLLGYQLLMPGIAISVLTTYLDAALVLGDGPLPTRAWSAITAIGRQPIGLAVTAAAGLTAIAVGAMPTVAWYGPAQAASLLVGPPNPDWVPGAIGAALAVAPTTLGSAVLGALFTASAGPEGPVAPLDRDNPFAG